MPWALDYSKSPGPTVDVRNALGTSAKSIMRGLASPTGVSMAAIIPSQQRGVGGHSPIDGRKHG